MKNKLKFMYIILFFMICLIPVCTMPIFSITNQNTENRQKATLPKIMNENSINLEYFEELNNYLEDSFNFRENLIAINSMMMEKAN